MLSMFYAAVLALIYVGLSLYVVKGRWQHRAALGHGPDSVLERRVRMHGNFAEYVPIALILLFMLDVAKFPPLGMHILGIMLLAGRVLHLWGLNKAPVSKGRFIGMVLTLLMILIAALLLLYHFFMILMTGFN